MTGDDTQCFYKKLLDSYIGGGYNIYVFSFSKNIDGRLDDIYERMKTKLYPCQFIIYKDSEDKTKPEAVECYKIIHINSYVDCPDVIYAPSIPKVFATKECMLKYYNDHFSKKVFETQSVPTFNGLTKEEISAISVRIMVNVTKYINIYEWAYSHPAYPEEDIEEEIFTKRSFLATFTKHGHSPYILTKIEYDKSCINSDDIAMDAIIENDRSFDRWSVAWEQREVFMKTYFDDEFCDQNYSRSIYPCMHHFKKQFGKSIYKKLQKKIRKIFHGAYVIASDRSYKRMKTNQTNVMYGALGDVLPYDIVKLITREVIWQNDLCNDIFP